MTSFLIRKRRGKEYRGEDDVKTEEGKLCDNRGKGWSYAAISQERLQIDMQKILP